MRFAACLLLSASLAACAAAPATAPGDPREQAPVSCDTRQRRCRRAPPECGPLEAPSVVDGCFGPCVPIAACTCTVAEDCPDRSRFTCHLSAQRCGPYVE